MPSHFTSQIIRCAIVLACIVAGGKALAQDMQAADDEALKAAREAAAGIPEPTAFDWQLLDPSIAPPDIRKLKAPSGKNAQSSANAAWDRADKPNGTAALNVKQPVTPFWDTRVGADINVAPLPATSADVLTQRMTDTNVQSGGAAWAAMNAPGVVGLWDKTAIEARVDPLQDQAKLGTAISKTLPIGSQYGLTLQNGVNVTQQNTLPIPGFNAHAIRSYETDRSAKFTVNDSGTSFIAGEKTTTIDEKALRRIGAEQKLFGGLSITGTVNETHEGTLNRGLGASFKKSW